jgi:hypothetical protein
MRSQLACVLIPALGISALGYSGLGAQIAPGNAVVASRSTGSPATLLFAVDLQSGVATALPVFPGHSLPPLAVEFDRVDGDLLLAVDAGGLSRVFRYTVQGGVPVAERLLGDIPGHVTELAPGNLTILAAVDGPAGGVWQLPRSGGQASLLLSLPFLTVLQTGGTDNGPATVVWSGNPVPPATDPGAGLVTLGTGSFFFGPTTFTGYAHPNITGATTLPFPQPRLVLSQSDGTFAYHQMLLGGGAQPVPIAVQPPPPPGSANAMKPAPALNNRPLVLGGSAFPQLWTFDPMAVTPLMTTIGAPLPGDPVDFGIAPPATAALVTFGAACPPAAMMLGAQGSPVLGTAFAIVLDNGAANALALFAVGFSDQLGGVLPFLLPSGCALHVAPDAVLVHVTDGAGHASQALTVPNQPGLVGLQLFAQWLQAPGLPFATSDAVAIRVGS